MAQILVVVRVAPQDVELTLAAARVLHCDAGQLKPLIGGRATVVFSFTFLDDDPEKAEREARGHIDAYLLRHQIPFEHVATHRDRDPIAVSTFTIHRIADGDDTSEDIPVRAVDRAEFEERMRGLQKIRYLPAPKGDAATEYVITIDGPAASDPDTQEPPFHHPKR